MPTAATIGRKVQHIPTAIKVASRAWLRGWCFNASVASLTIAARIVIIAVTISLPLNLVIAAIIWHLSESASEGQRTSLLYTARSVAAATSAKLDKYLALAEALARSPLLLEDNLDAFEAEARRTFASTADTIVVVVANPGGQQLMNTARQPGQALPIRDPIGLATEQRAFATHSTVISGVHLGRLSQQWFINIEVPIFKDGKPFRSLAAAVKAQSFAHLLNDQHLPRDWLAAIFDAEGRYISRATEREDDERYIGQLSSESWRNVTDRHGVFEVTSPEGDTVVAAKAHSELGGWHVGVAVKKATVQAATWDAIRWALILGGGFSVISFLLAALVARSITRPIADIRNNASVFLNREKRATSPSSAPPEVNELWRALQDSAAERDRSEAALRESEERLRLSNEAAGIGIFTIDLETDCAYCSPELAEMLGIAELRTAKIRDAFLQVHRDDLARVRAQYEHALSVADDGKMKADFRFVRPCGEIRWMTRAGRVEFREGASGKRPFRIFGACVDITERKRAEDHIRLLMREVNHRSKNLLSLVQAIARQTAAASPADFVARFTERIQALAASQDLLVKNEWKGVDLDALVRSQLGHFHDLIGKRIELQGPPLLVSAAAAQTIGMALHELATNAGKYGAFAAANGRVEIAWRLEPGSAKAETFLISWCEKCADLIAAPSKRGFGSIVIREMTEMSLDGEVNLAFAPDGLSWQFECPAVRVLEKGHFGAADTGNAPTDRGASAETGASNVMIEDNNPVRPDPSAAGAG